MKLLKLVAEETEVPEENILGNDKDMETTDARYVLVILLSEVGMYPKQVAILLNRTSRGIRHLMSRNMTSPMIGIYLERVRKRAGSEDSKRVR
ncbi:hypothetical protein [Bacteroides sp. AM16-24]|uniref:hypothetical protein n=1 Tax=Bacteroides sp. AM16-24 TaxID=2292002 RepID=UPI001F3644F5|nr:hypothetical protein [Bacteroides sp. AM16-24]